jgi:hypothetical protein
MMPTATIIATAVERAATKTDVRRSEPAKLREANIASTPNTRPSNPADKLANVATRAGIANVDAAISKTVATYPKIGRPSQAGCFDAIQANAAKSAAISNPRSLWIRT